MFLGGNQNDPQQLYPVTASRVADSGRQKSSGAFWVETCHKRVNTRSNQTEKTLLI